MSVALIAFIPVLQTRRCRVETHFSICSGYRFGQGLGWEFPASSANLLRAGGFRRCSLWKFLGEVQMSVSDIPQPLHTVEYRFGRDWIIHHVVVLLFLEEE